MITQRRSLWCEDSGAVFAEFAVLLPVVVTIVCGSIDFLYAFYQWNAAAKAAEVGARIAAVSDPVAADLNDLSNQAVMGGLAAWLGYSTIYCNVQRRYVHLHRHLYWPGREFIQPSRYGPHRVRPG